MKIAVIVGATYPVIGGTELASYKTAQKLAENGHEVTIITRYTQGIHTDTMKQAEPMTEYEEHSNLKVYRAVRWPIIWGGALSHLFKALKVTWHHPPQVILSFALSKHSLVAIMLRWLLMVTRLKTVPVIVWGRGTRLFVKAKQTGVKAWLLRRLFGLLFRAKIVIAHSPFMRREITNFGCQNDKIYIVGNAIDIQDNAVVRTPDPNTVVFVGTARQVKGLWYLIRAVKEMPNAKLIIVGGYGEDATACRRLAKLNPNITFLGPVSPAKVPHYLARAQVFCLPSLHESFPNVVLEAMNAGVPVVTTNIEGIPYAVGDAALLVPPKDPQALKNAIRSLFNDAKLRSQLARKGREQVKEFSWEVMLPRLEQILELATS